MAWLCQKYLISWKCLIWECFISLTFHFIIKRVKWHFGSAWLFLKTVGHLFVDVRYIWKFYSLCVYVWLMSGGGNGNLLQNSCLKNPMDRGAWQATVHQVPKGQTLLKWLRMHAFFPLPGYTFFSQLPEPHPVMTSFLFTGHFFLDAFADLLIHLTW